MVYDAVILAGGRICEELRAAAAYDNEAFIMIAGQPMILYVYKALRQCPSIRKIVISGPMEELQKIIPEDEMLFFVPSGDNAIESLSYAIQLLQEKDLKSILVMPTDIPFISSEAIEDFIMQAEKSRKGIFLCPDQQRNKRKKFWVLRTMYN